MTSFSSNILQSSLYLCFLRQNTLLLVIVPLICALTLDLIAACAFNHGSPLRVADGISVDPPLRRGSARVREREREREAGR